MEKATFRSLCLIYLLISTTAFSQDDTCSFTGQVFYHDNYPMSGVNTYLNSMDGQPVDTAITDYTGEFTFENLIPGNYVITYSTDQPAGGVEIDDANLVLLYLEGDTTFTPIQEIAADVNGNGIINMGDYNQILNSYLNRGNPFPIGPWVFETDTIAIPYISREGFVSKSGSSSGDVNGTLTPDPKTNNIFMNSPVIDLTRSSSDAIEFNLSGEQDFIFTGLHLVINVPVGLNVIGVESIIPDENIFVSGNQIRITWIDEDKEGLEIAAGNPFVVIRTETQSNSRESQSYSLKVEDESHFMNKDGNLLPGVSLVLPTINLTIQREMSISTYPNPFANHTTFEYTVPQDGQVNIDLFDRSGRKVMEVENSFRPAGNHQVKIDGTGLLTGVYFYSIRNSGNGQLINSGSVIKSK